MFYVHRTSTGTRLVLYMIAVGDITNRVIDCSGSLRGSAVLAWADRTSSLAAMRTA